MWQGGSKKLSTAGSRSLLVAAKLAHTAVSTVPPACSHEAQPVPPPVPCHPTALQSSLHLPSCSASSFPRRRMSCGAPPHTALTTSPAPPLPAPLALASGAGVSMLHVFRAIDKNRDGRLDLRELQGG